MPQIALAGVEFAPPGRRLPEHASRAGRLTRSNSAACT